MSAKFFIPAMILKEVRKEVLDSLMTLDLDRIKGYFKSVDAMDLFDTFVDRYTKLCLRLKNS